MDSCSIIEKLIKASFLTSIEVFFTSVIFLTHPLVDEGEAEVMKKKLCFAFLICLFVASLYFGKTDKTASLESHSVSVQREGSSLDVFFFYGEGCPHCERVKPYLTEMEQKYPLNLHWYDIYNDRDRILLFDEYSNKYGLLQEQRGIPTIFVSDTYFVGDTPILEGFEEAVKKAYQESSLSDQNRTSENSAVVKAAIEGDSDACNPEKSGSLDCLSFLTLTTAALVDSINPCAIAILVFLIGARVLVTNQKKRALKVGLSFCLSVFVAYFLFGMGLLTVVQLGGFSGIFSLLVGLFAVLVGILSFKDVFWSGRSGFKMEVPQSLKPVLMKLLKKVTSPWGAFAMGFVAVCFELPCTGGPYLFILGQVANGATRLRAVPSLLYYNFIFVLPLVMISLLLYSNLFSVEKARDWNNRNKSLLRLVEGVVMISLGFFAIPVSQMLPFLQMFLLCYKVVGPVVLLIMFSYSFFSSPKRKSLAKRVMRFPRLGTLLLSLIVLPMISSPMLFVTSHTNSSTLIPAFVLLSSVDASSWHEARYLIESRGGRITHVYPPNVLIGYVSETTSRDLIGKGSIEEIYFGAVDPKTLKEYGPTALYAATAFNSNFVGSHSSEDELPSPGPIVGDVRQAPDYSVASGLTVLGVRDPQQSETSLFMIGDTSVAIVLMESNGTIDANSENWDSGRMNQVVSNIQGGLNWWISQEARAKVTWIYHVYYQVPTGYEPIIRSSFQDSLWINDAMSYFGVPGSYAYSRVRLFDDNMRKSDGTDWAFTVFVVDSLNDPDGKFSNGYFGYAYLGGPYFVMTYDNDGWGIGRMDKVAAHETAHIFNAGDEYCQPGYACCGCGNYGFLNIPNSKCEAGCYSGYGAGCGGCQTSNCLMDDNSWCLTTPTRYQLGWRDLDSDGILDAIDSNYNSWGDIDGDGIVDYSDDCPTDSGSIGNDGCASTCHRVIKTDTTLTSDISCGETTIVVKRDNIVLDCNGHSLTGSGTGKGIDLTGRSGVTVKHCNISSYSSGVHLSANSVSNIVSWNNIFNNNYNLYNDQSNNVKAELNWWGQSICRFIDPHIYDNEEGRGEVDFDPVLDNPYPTGTAKVCDYSAPALRNQRQSNSTPSLLDTIYLSVEAFDDKGLDWAVLSTNETGTWQNRSSLSMGDVANQWVVANFSWSNPSLQIGTIVSWRIRLNDTSANEASTDVFSFFVQSPETVPPYWKDQGQSKTIILKEYSNSLCAQARDDSGLSHTWLATNETGQWQSKTSLILSTLSDSSTAKNITFTGNQSQTVYLNIPKNVTVLNAQLNLSGYQSPGWIYQESPNTTYTPYPAFWNSTYSYTNVFDANWSTYGKRVSGYYARLYLNYSKPPKFISANIKGRDCGWVYPCTSPWDFETTLSSSCLIQTPIQIQVASNGGVEWFCYNGTGWDRFRYLGSWWDIYEEAINWNVWMLPKNPYLDVASDSDVQWSYSGEYNQTNMTADFSSEINQYLSTCSTDPCDVPLVLHSDTAGIIQVSDIKIVYNYNQHSLLNMYGSTDWTWSNFTWKNASIPLDTTIAWRIYYNDTYGNEAVTNILTFRVVAEDAVPPSWRNQGQSKDAILPEEENSLYAEVLDAVGLDYAWMATNETGTWQNKTSLVLNSLSDSSTAKNVTFTGNQNEMVWIRIPKDANVINAQLNLSGYNNPFFKEHIPGQTAYDAVWYGGWSPSPTNAWDNNWSTYTGVVVPYEYEPGLRSTTNYGNLYVNFSVLNVNYSFINISVKSQMAEDYEGGSQSMAIYLWNYTYGVWDVKLSRDNAVGTYHDNITIGNITTYINNSVIMIRVYGYAHSVNLITYSETDIYEISIVTDGYPTNPYLDVANDGDNQWSYSGIFNHTNNRTSDFSSDMNQYLSTCSTDPCDVPLVLHSDTAGIIQVSDIKIVYNYNQHSAMNWHGSTDWTWSNFTWKNASIPSSTTIAWRIYYNDTAGNEAATNIMTFHVIADNDGDGVPLESDSCPITFNPDQLDTDLDGKGDVCDICPLDPNDSCDPQQATSDTLDEAGGSIITESGLAKLEIPPGALSEDTSLFISGTNDTAQFDESQTETGLVSTSFIYTFGPETTVLSLPVKITLKYNDLGIIEDTIDIYYYNTETHTWAKQNSICNRDQNECHLNVTYLGSYVTGGIRIAPPLSYVTILSPQNGSYNKPPVFLDFRIMGDTSWIRYSLDDQPNVTITGPMYLSNLSEGLHHVIMYASDTYGYVGVSDRTCFTVDSIPPAIAVVSPESVTYNSSSIKLELETNESTVWIGYSLDGQTNMTLWRNVTAGIYSKYIHIPTDGPHSIVVYANDTAGNIGTSSIISFTTNSIFYGQWQTNFIAPNGYPIVDFATYNGKLYAAANDKLYEFDGGIWNIINAPNYVTSLEPYETKLVVGGQGGLYYFDGATFRLVFSVPTYIKMLGIYNNKLYVGTFLAKPPVLYYCNGSIENPADWYVDTAFSVLLNFSGPFGSIDSFAVYDSVMYVSSGGKLYSFNGVSWSIMASYDDVSAFLAMKVYDGKMYLATRDQGWRKPLYQGGTGFSGRVIEFDGENWTTVLDHDYWVYSLEEYDGKLYAGTANKILTYNGTSWETSFSATEGAYYAISLITYDGKIYAGMGNGYIFADPAPPKTNPETIAVPEFSSNTILAVLMALTMLAAALTRKNRTKRFD
jgi:cytochrome c biogenesis protein CcdA/glutaredoxin